LAGDEFRDRAKFEEEGPGKSPDEDAALTERVNALFRKFGGRLYPYAGSVAFSHTFLYFWRHGRSVFKELSKRTEPRLPEESGALRFARGTRFCRVTFDLQEVSDRLASGRPAIERAFEEAVTISREVHEETTAALPWVRPRPGLRIFRPIALTPQSDEHVLRPTNPLDGRRSAREVIDLFSGDKAFAREQLERLYAQGILEADAVAENGRPLVAGRALAAF